MRNKKDALYWEIRANNLFDINPNYRSTKLRYEVLLLLLDDKYKNITDNPAIIDFLKDVVYLDRKLRLLTEGEEVELKEELSNDWKENNGY